MEKKKAGNCTESDNAAEQVRRYYSQRNVAQNYICERFRSPLGDLLHSKQLAIVNRLAQKLQPQWTLEIAPGPARLTCHVGVPGQLVCLEYNVAMIDQGRQYTAENVSWVRGDAFALPFSEIFDFVYTFRFIRHFQSEDRFRIYEQIKNVLKPGGVLVFDAVNAVVSRPLRQKNPEEYPIFDQLYDNLDQIRSELSMVGFGFESAQPVQRWFGLQARIQNLVAPRSWTLARLMIGVVERIWSGHPLEWIVACRK